MADVNAWSITGRLTKDAEYKTLASGKGLLVADVAVNTGYGAYKKTTFVKVQQWGERGANALPYLKKGSLVGCTGELTVNEWESNGVKNKSLQLDVSSIQLLASKKSDDNDKAEDVPPVDDAVF